MDTRKEYMSNQNYLNSACSAYPLSQNDDEVLIKETLCHDDEFGQGFGHGLYLSQLSQQFQNDNDYIYNNSNDKSRSLNQSIATNNRALMMMSRKYRRRNQQRPTTRKDGVSTCDSPSEIDCHPSQLDSQLPNSNAFAALESLIMESHDDVDNQHTNDQQHNQHSSRQQQTYHTDQDILHIANKQKYHETENQKENKFNQSTRNIPSFVPVGTEIHEETSTVTIGNTTLETPQAATNNLGCIQELDRFDDTFPLPDSPTQNSGQEKMSEVPSESTISDLPSHMHRHVHKEQACTTMEGNLNTEQQKHFSSLMTKSTNKKNDVLEISRRFAATMDTKTSDPKLSLSLTASSFINKKRSQTSKPKKVSVSRASKSIVGSRYVSLHFPSTMGCIIIMLANLRKQFFFLYIEASQLFPHPPPRPKHWCKQGNAVSTAPLYTRQTNRTGRESKLIDATCKSDLLRKSAPVSFLMLPPPNRKTPASANSLFSRNITLNDDERYDPYFQTPTRDASCNTTKTFNPALLLSRTTNSHKQCHSDSDSVMDDNVSISRDGDSISFLRSLNAGDVSSPGNSMEDNRIIEHQYHQEQQQEQPQHSTIVSVLHPESPPPNKKNARSRSKIGPLSKRLKCLRDRAKGDMIRFQSGQYPFAGRNNNVGHASHLFSRDGNDPRKRASNYLDISIVSPVIPLGKHNDRLLVALGFVHTYQEKDKRISDFCVDQQHEATRKGLAWILFLFDTAREQNLAQGSELRIYNTNWIPIQESPNLLVSFNDSTVRKNSQVHWVITCTQLCEPYPSTVLPPLPKFDNHSDFSHHEEAMIP